MDDMAKVEQGEQQANEKVTSSVASMVQGLPERPIDAATYNAFATTVEAAVDTFGAGQVESEQGPPVEGDVTAGTIDPKLARNVIALAQVFATYPEGKAYEFDPKAALGSPDGMAEAGATIASAQKDAKLVRALTSPGAPPSASTKAAPEPKGSAPKADEFM